MPSRAQIRNGQLAHPFGQDAKMVDQVEKYAAVHGTHDPLLIGILKNGEAAYLSSYSAPDVDAIHAKILTALYTINGQLTPNGAVEESRTRRERMVLQKQTILLQLLDRLRTSQDATVQLFYATHISHENEALDFVIGAFRLMDLTEWGTGDQPIQAVAAPSRLKWIYKRVQHPKYRVTSFRINENAHVREFCDENVGKLQKGEYVLFNCFHGLMRDMDKVFNDTAGTDVVPVFIVIGHGLARGPSQFMANRKAERPKDPLTEDPGCTQCFAFDATKNKWSTEDKRFPIKRIVDHLDTHKRQCLLAIFSCRIDYKKDALGDTANVARPTENVSLIYAVQPGARFTEEWEQDPTRFWLLQELHWYCRLIDALKALKKRNMPDIPALPTDHNVKTGEAPPQENAKRPRTKMDPHFVE